MLVFKIVESLQCILIINLIRGKFKSVVKGSSTVDLLMLSETKIDENFPKGQFLIKGLVILLESIETGGKNFVLC